MTMRRRVSSWLGVAALGLLVGASAGVARAQEHPEHPTDKPKLESKGVTIPELADAITEYVKKDSALKGGFFFVYDPVDKAPLALTLDHVHTERLSRVGPNTYFACADFKATDGKIYDLDVFMQGPERESLQVTEVAVHKKAGIERYTWYEEGGVWKKKLVAAGK